VIFDQATDGKNTILVMLLVGVVFLLTIALGELVHWAGHRKHVRKQRASTY
jgi:hypothetical protein